MGDDISGSEDLRQIWNYSPPGMKDIRFYGRRTSQKIKTAHPAVGTLPFFPPILI